MNFDAVIVGAGAAGLMAALRAALGGARVAVLEIGDGERSNLAASGGLFAGAGTRFQAKSGVTDSPAQWADDIVRKTGGAVDPVIVGAVTSRSADAVHFLADEIGVDVHLSTGVPFPGHSAVRLHATEAQDGRQLATLLRTAARRTAAIRMFEQTEATGLIVEAGAVVGVVTAAGERFTAPWTLLASGGFAANSEMIARFAPEIVGAVNIGCGPNDGRAIHWGSSLGGELLFMDSYQGQGHVTIDGLGRLGAGVTSLGAIVLNAEGQRFADEAMGPSEFGAFVLAQPGGWAVEVFDEAMHETMLRIGTYRDCVARGCIVSVATPEDLAARFALPSQAVVRTLQQYRAPSRARSRTRSVACLPGACCARPFAPPVLPAHSRIPRAACASMRDHACCERTAVSLQICSRPAASRPAFRVTVRPDTSRATALVRLSRSD